MNFVLDAELRITKRREDIVTNFWPLTEDRQTRPYDTKLKLLVDDDYNVGIRNSFERHAGTPYVDGAFELENVSLIDEWGFIFRESDGCCPFGITGFGWNGDHLAHLANLGRMHTGEGPHAPRMNYKVSQRRRLDGSTVLLSFPGALTYGHWFFDVVGRLFSAQEKWLKQANQFLFPVRWCAWMDRFVAVMGIAKKDIVFLDNETLFECAHLIVPTVPSQAPAGTVSHGVMREVQTRFAFMYENWTKSTVGCAYDMCILKHTPMTSARTRVLGNVEQLYDSAIARGLKASILDPLKCSFADTLRGIDNAKICIGQDSSALHNMICTPKPLIVIETEKRSNMLHCCIQAAGDAGIGYVGSEKRDTGWFLDPARALDVVETVLKA